MTCSRACVSNSFRASVFGSRVGRYSIFYWGGGFEKGPRLMAASISASSSVSPTPELDLNEDGPECSPDDPRRLCLKAEDRVGLCLVGEGELSFSLLLFPVLLL